MVVGQLIELDPIRTRAVAWSSTDPRGDWTRLDLPGPGATTIAADPGISRPGGWLVAGARTTRRSPGGSPPILTVTRVAIFAWAADVGVAAVTLDTLIVAGDDGTVR